MIALNLLTDLPRNALLECKEEAHFCKSARGAANLMDSEGHVYYKHKNSSSGKVFWDCRDRRKIKCHGRATTSGFVIVKKSAHNHPPPIDEYEIQD